VGRGRREKRRSSPNVLCVTKCTQTKRREKERDGLERTNSILVDRKIKGEKTKLTGLSAGNTGTLEKA